MESKKVDGKFIRTKRDGYRIVLNFLKGNYEHTDNKNDILPEAIAFIEEHVQALDRPRKPTKKEMEKQTANNALRSELVMWLKDMEGGHRVTDIIANCPAMAGLSCQKVSSLLATDNVKQYYEKSVSYYKYDAEFMRSEIFKDAVPHGSISGAMIRKLFEEEEQKEKMTGGKMVANLLLGQELPVDD